MTTNDPSISNVYSMMSMMPAQGAPMDWSFGIFDR